MFKVSFISQKRQAHGHSFNYKAFNMKFALLSVTYSGLFYKGKALTLEEQVYKAKQMGFEGLAIETKRPIASPLDLTKADRQRLKSVAADEGVQLCAVESMSNFSSRISEDRENNLAMMRMVLDLAKDLNVSLVKVFAAWPGIIDDEQPLAMYAPYDRGNYFKPLSTPDLLPWKRAVEGIREVAMWAEDMGITIALQNHAPLLTPGYEDTLEMMQDVGRRNVKLCLDVPLFFDRQKSDYVKRAVETCASDIVYTHYGAWNLHEEPNGEVDQDPAPTHGGHINYEVFIEELIKSGYNGYLASEYCLPMIRKHQIAGIEEVDKATVMGIRYMQRIIAEAKSRLAKQSSGGKVVLNS
jgi:sugar phosphate isomerase/epimerase